MKNLLKQIWSSGKVQAIWLSIMFAFILWVIAGIALDYLVPTTKADNTDMVLEQLNNSYNQNIEAETNALQSYYSASIARCEGEKALAQYKVYKGYETERTEELKQKASMQCGAF